MVSLEIVASIADAFDETQAFNEHILNASARRGTVEFRVQSPWGFKLVEVEDFQLIKELHPDADSFRFAGQLGRFGLDGYFLTLLSEGEMNIYATENEEVELLPLFKRNKPMTALEAIMGYPGMTDNSE